MYSMAIEWADSGIRINSVAPVRMICVPSNPGIGEFIMHGFSFFFVSRE